MRLRLLVKRADQEGGDPAVREVGFEMAYEAEFEFMRLVVED